MHRTSHVCVVVYGLMLILTAPLYAKTPVPRFTVWTIEHQGKVSAKSYTGVSPLGVTEYKKIEVKKLESILKEIEMPVLTDIFIRQLVRSSKFTVLERTKVDKLLGEIRMGEDGFIDQDKITKKGKMLGADYLVIGTVVQANAGVGYKQVSYTEQNYRIKEGIIRVDLRVIKTASGEILTTQQEQGEGQVFNKTMVGSMSVNPVSNDFPHDLQEALATDLTVKIVDVFYPFKVVLVKRQDHHGQQGT
jgi:curli biogenesis system outer membrane secretion channel CsgG